MAKPPTKTKKTSASKTPEAKAYGLPNYVDYSDSGKDEQGVFIILGKTGVGKTFSWLSISDYRTNLVGPEPKMRDMEDLVLAEADSLGSAGLKHNNMRVRRFVFGRALAEGKSIGYALNKFIEFLLLPSVWSTDLKVGVDLTGLDRFMFAQNVKASKGSPNKFEAYRLNFLDHVEFSQMIKGTNLHICYMCHGRQANEGDKDAVVKLPGGGEIVPDLIGQAPKFYKTDASLQVAVVAKRGPRDKKFQRELLFGLEADSKGYEGKNRFEGLIPDRQSPPNLREILRIINRGKR
jgi:hypothetical protein